MYEAGGMWSAYGGEMRHWHKTSINEMKGKERLEDLDVDGKLLLNWALTIIIPDLNQSCERSRRLD